MMVLTSDCLPGPFLALAVCQVPPVRDGRAAPAEPSTYTTVTALSDASRFTVGIVRGLLYNRLSDPPIINGSRRNDAAHRRSDFDTDFLTFSHDSCDLSLRLSTHKRGFELCIERNDADLMSVSTTTGIQLEHIDTHSEPRTVDRVHLNEQQYL